MASEAEWRFEFPALAEAVNRAINEHEQSSTLFAGVVLDSRHVAGALDVAAGLKSIRRAASQNHRFVLRSAELAVKQAIPIGFFGNLVVRDLGEHEGVLNIKTGGIHPVVELARVFALRVGSVATGTVERIQDAARSGALDSDHAEGLIEAFELMIEVRLRHQLDSRRLGVRPDDLIDPGGLGPLTKSQLKVAFRIVREVQRQVAHEIEPHAR
jgi:CBS domain-containing protein